MDSELHFSKNCWSLEKRIAYPGTKFQSNFPGSGLDVAIRSFEIIQPT